MLDFALLCKNYKNWNVWLQSSSCFGEALQWSRRAVVTKEDKIKLFMKAWSLNVGLNKWLVLVVVWYVVLKVLDPCQLWCCFLAMSVVLLYLGVHNLITTDVDSFIFFFMHHVCTFITLPWEWCKVYQWACPCVRLYAYLKSYISCPKFHQIYYTCGLGFVLHWRQCNALCTSGFVDDIMFSHNADSRAEAKTTLCFVQFARWQHWWRSCCLRLPYIDFVI